MTIKAIVFDLDGTLAEFNLDYKTVRAETIHFLINQGFPASIFSISESIFEMLKKAKVYLKNNDKEDKEFATIQKQVLSIARKHELKAARETSLLPGVFETLKILKEKKMKLAIFTINGEKSTSLILKNFRLQQFFDAVVTREEALRVKPDPTHLAVVLKALNVSSKEAIVVGDSITDITSAKNLDVVAVGLAANGTTIEKLNAAGATHIIRSITDLPSLIANLNQ